MADQQQQNNKNNGIKDQQSDDSKRNTRNVTSQADLPEPKMEREDLPEADQKNFKDGVYKGTGTGAGPGGSTATGGADTSTMEGQARLGTTDKQPNANTLGSSERDGTTK